MQYMYFLILLQQSEVCTVATEITCTSLLASGDENLSKNDWNHSGERKNKIEIIVQTKRVECFEMS